MSATFERVRQLVAAGRERISDHGMAELEKDDIFEEEAIVSIVTGVAVEDYPDAWKGPTVLVRQTLKSGRYIHALWGLAKGNDQLAVLITAYFPDPTLWSTDFLVRQRS